MRRKILLWSGIASSVLYIVTDLVGSRRYDGYSWADQHFSELTAEGSPVRSLMIAVNGIPYTLLVIAFGVGVWASPGAARAARITGALLVGYAITGAAGGIAVPMATRATIEAGGETTRNLLHIPATALMSVCIMLAIGVGGRLAGPPFRAYSWVTIGTLLLFGMLTSLQARNFETGDPTPWAGLEQRVNIYATMLWIGVLAVLLLRAGRPVIAHPIAPTRATLPPVQGEARTGRA